MLKKLLCCLTVFTYTLSYAQNIPNPSFENWIQYGGYKDPEGWFTINALTILGGSATALQATGADAHSGSSAIRLRSIAIFGQVAPGIAATGTINPTTQSVEGGFAFDQRPVFLSGWYQYAPAGMDTASIGISLTRWNVQTQTTEVVGEGGISEASTVNEYTRFWIPIIYFSSEIPDTASIVLLSSAGENGVANSTLLIDDLSFENDFPVSSSSTANPSTQVALYPMPAGNSCFLDNPTGQFTKLEIYNLTGQRTATIALTEGTNNIDISTLKDGIYTYRVSHQNGTLATTGKLSILR
ncbi:MAG: T9SS type A sorting domain-containing protein [Sphingobacteriales bacterium]|nr:MAG: T9SS type A sorting domain-containing protein [Sphingobacteriales bacterium]